MIRKAVIFFAVMVMTIVTIGTVTGSDKKKDEKKGSATMVVNGGSYGNIPFPHKTHQETLVDCNTCHRLFPKAMGSIAEMKSSGKIKRRQVMNECRACHKDRKKNGQKAGPTSCSGCHKN